MMYITKIIKDQDFFTLVVEESTQDLKTDNESIFNSVRSFLEERYEEHLEIFNVGTQDIYDEERKFPISFLVAIVYPKTKGIIEMISEEYGIEVKISSSK